MPFHLIQSVSQHIEVDVTIPAKLPRTSFIQSRNYIVSCGIKTEFKYLVGVKIVRIFQQTHTFIDTSQSHRRTRCGCHGDLNRLTRPTNIVTESNHHLKPTMQKGNVTAGFQVSKLQK